MHRSWRSASYPLISSTGIAMAVLVVLRRKAVVQGASDKRRYAAEDRLHLGVAWQVGYSRVKMNIIFMIDLSAL